MKPSVPIYQLKRRARTLSRAEGIPLHAALDRIAVAQGHRNWSLLVRRATGVERQAARLFRQLRPGDLLLIAARPEQGKTLMGLELAIEAMRAGHRGYFFTLEYTLNEVGDRLRLLGADMAQFAGRLEVDCSNAISADYIVDKLAAASRNAVVVIDYLQLLDQNRRKPELGVQIAALRTFARKAGLIVAFLSQIDRSYDPARKACPDHRDVRLPNPLDLRAFDKACFMQGGEVRFEATAR